MVEGKGYCARRQERLNVKKMAEFIKNREKIIVIPNLTEKKDEISEKNRKKKG